MEKRLLRLLIVDESPDDAEQVIDLLRHAGYMLKTQRVQDAAGLQKELARAEWDLVLCEFKLAHIDARLALDMLKQSGCDLPFIVSTRRISDAEIASVMRAGARDVVIKDAAGRLVPAIERELQALQDRAGRAAVERALKEIEDKHRALVESSREAVCYSQDGMHLDANRAYLELFGYQDLAELEGVPFLNLVDQKDHAEIKKYFRKPGAAAPCGFVAVNRQGERFHAEIALSPITLGGESCQQIIVSDVSKRKAAEQKLAYLNQHDALTGLYNRHHFLEELGKTLERAQTGQANTVMLYINIEQLRTINEELGFDAGDRVLLHLARLFRETLRPQDFVARLSGAEFSALLHDVDRKEAERLAGEITRALKAAPLSEQGKTRECACTVGVIDIDRAAPSVQQILNRAQAQNAGEIRARREAASPAPAKAPAVAPAKPPTLAPAPAPIVPIEQGKSGWGSRVESALARDRFHLAYQPIVNLHADASESYEVLVRMLGDDEGTISAREFMAAAEAASLAPRIDRFVCGKVIEGLPGLANKGRNIRFFINVSQATLCDESFIRFLSERLQAAGMNGRFLVFEIDELALSRHRAEAVNFIRGVKKLGCDLTIDNCSLANLAFLRQHPISYLKISGMLTQNLVNDGVNQAIIKTMSEVARTLGKKTIATWVESAETLSALWSFQIDYVQGHYFQAPHPELAYDFNIESVSSDHAVAGWASR